MPNSADLLDASGKSLLPGSSVAPSLRVAIAERFKSSSVTSWLTDAGETVEGQNSLVSAARSPFADVIVVRSVDKAAAFASVKRLGATFGLMFILIFFLALAAGVGLVSRLTAKLGELATAADAIGQGDYDVRVTSNSSDEIGTLAKRFNQMAKEVSDSMKSRAEKARMEAELNTAKEVQDKLFPATVAEIGRLKVAGFYEPASECGGDWWSYGRVANHAVLFIGDATGHGAPAALITSAVKATATIALRQGLSDPSVIMDMLNAAVHETSKGTICMTFFVASVDLGGGSLTYCNASHEAVYVMRKGAEFESWSDIPTLEGNNHPRLGESLSTAFSNSTATLQAGDALFAYTDGLMDVVDAAGRSFGERRIASSLLASSKSEAAPTAISDGVKDHFQAFRAGTPLVDDVSFFSARLS